MQQKCRMVVIQSLCHAGMEDFEGHPLKESRSHFHAWPIIRSACAIRATCISFASPTRKAFTSQHAEPASDDRLEVCSLSTFCPKTMSQPLLITLKGKPTQHQQQRVAPLRAAVQEACGMECSQGLRMCVWDHSRCNSKSVFFLHKLAFYSRSCRHSDVSGMDSAHNHCRPRVSASFILLELQPR